MIHRCTNRLVLCQELCIDNAVFIAELQINNIDPNLCVKK